MTLGNDEKNWIGAREEFEAINTIDEINSFIEDRSKSHDVYFHYTGVDQYKSIITKKQIWLSDVIFANDREEAERARKERNRNFFFCMSAPTNKEESLSMWYLYNKGKGVCLKLSANFIKDIEKNKNPILIEIEMNGDSIVTKEIQKLEVNDFNIVTRDLVYFRKYCSSEKVVVKTNDFENSNFSVNQIDDYSKCNPLVYKDIVWESEHETRILATISENISKKLSQQKQYAMVFELSQEVIDRIHPIKGVECDCDDILLENLSESSLKGKVNVPFWKNKIHRRGLFECLRNCILTLKKYILRWLFQQ